MATKILMPKLSPTMEEGQISSWIKNEGDEIEANETIAEVDTDKATMEMTSLDAGTLLKIVVPAGSNAKLGQTIGVIGEPNEDISAILDEIGNESAADKSEPNTSVNSEPPQPVTAEVSNAYSVPAAERALAVNSNERIIVSPIASRMALENNLNLHAISGSGPNGRIIKRDIEKALAGTTTSGTTAFAQNANVTGASAYRDENTTPMRRTIAKRLGESIGPIPTFYLTVEIEMDNALALRAAINEQIAPEKISVNDIIVKVAAMALTKHSFVNASYQTESIRFYEDADIGVAVAVDEGLITPIVRGANKKGFVQISNEIRELATRARDKKLQPEEYTGATFSISNLGMFGIKEFTAIINPPEAAILAVGGAEEVPVVRNGAIVSRKIMHVTMSCDHRVVDGATGAKFLQTFKAMLENPAMMLV
ncbi:MAG: pyruvate dehydrogenase complex dihydrolipoamide acetyltransferase [Pyrinomonadaceae bacterium]